MDKIGTWFLVTGFLINTLGVCIWLIGAIIRVAQAGLEGWIK